MKLIRKMSIINQDFSINYNNISLFNDCFNSSFNYSIENSSEFSIDLETDLFDKENIYLRHNIFFGFPDNIK